MAPAVAAPTTTRSIGVAPAATSMTTVSSVQSTGASGARSVLDGTEAAPVEFVGSAPVDFIASDQATTITRGA